MGWRLSAATVGGLLTVVAGCGDQDDVATVTDDDSQESAEIAEEADEAGSEEDDEDTADSVADDEVTDDADEAGGDGDDATLLTEDFAEDRGAWDLPDSEHGRVFLDDGGLHIVDEPIDSDDSDDTVSHLTDHVFDDFLLDVDATLVDGTEDSLQEVFVRVQESEGHFTGYGFGVTADGWYGAFRYDPFDWEVLDGEEHPAVLTGVDATNRLQIEAVGADLRFSVNGEVVFETTDDSYAEGGIALGGLTHDDQHAHVAFTDLVVREP